MRKFPFIFIPLQIFYLSFPLLYEIPTLILFIPAPNSLHSHYFDTDSRIPIILLIPFSDPPFRLLQVGENFLNFALTT